MLKNSINLSLSALPFIEQQWKKDMKENPIERERKFIIESKFVTISIQPKRGCLALHSLSWVFSFEIYIIFFLFRLFCFNRLCFFYTEGERADESEDFFICMKSHIMISFKYIFFPLFAFYVDRQQEREGWSGRETENSSFRSTSKHGHQNGERMRVPISDKHII